MCECVSVRVCECVSVADVLDEQRYRKHLHNGGVAHTRAGNCGREVGRQVTVHHGCREPRRLDLIYGADSSLLAKDRMFR